MSGNEVNMRIQKDSSGILYIGYKDEFIECVFEDGDVAGVNERYEYRCPPELQCCGRECCTPQAATVPFWLMILFIVLALLLLMAILGTIAWLCSKRKRKPKPIKEYQRDQHHGLTSTAAGGYRSMKQHDDEERQMALENAYSTPADHLGIDRGYGRAGGRGYGNPMYGLNGRGTGGYRSTHDRESGLYAKAESATEGPVSGSGAYRSNLVVPVEGAGAQASTSGAHRLGGSDGSGDQQRGGAGAGAGGRHGPGYYHETFEEKFEEKYEMQRDDESEESEDSRELM